MQRKTTIRIAGGLSPFIGFAGTIVGIAFTFAVIEQTATPTLDDLMRCVGAALVATLGLIGFIIVPLAAWEQFRGHSDDD
jgi:biopolymer transport protein ExbB/TolQ